MLSKFTRQKNQQHLTLLPKIAQSPDKFHTLYSPEEYRRTLLKLVSQAQQRIYLIALYLEHDDAGQDLLTAIYQAKQANPQLEIAILVDWHRAQRGRIGVAAQATNADWYCAMKHQYPDVDVPIFGVPINTREALGVLHLKGSIIDDTVLYTGASINDVYLYRHDKYRYDRYQQITNPELADCFINYTKNNLLNSPAVHRLDDCQRPASTNIKKKVRNFRAKLRHSAYQFQPSADNRQLAVTPLVGLGKHSLLNKTIHHLIGAAEQKVTICTPYFNLPPHLVKRIVRQLRLKKQIEIIVGDKTANDFYIPEDQPFKMIGALPYLYEINLRHFAMRLQEFMDNGQLTIRLWKDLDNSYHLKGIWVDEQWTMITGNNLNPRAMRLDLENAILIHDPKRELSSQREQELALIRQNTYLITHYQQLQSHQFYPDKIRKLIRRLRRMKLDKLISRLL